jgi:hypothetical protein
MKLLALLALFGSVYGNVIAKTDAIPESCSHITDEYFEGYLQALIDTSYMDSHVKVVVKNRKIYLANLPSDQKNRISIINFVKDIPGVDENEVYELEAIPSEEAERRECHIRKPQIKGVWFPQMTELFQPIIADPRNVTYILGYRSGDHVIGVHCINIALGDDFGIYRWINVWGGWDVQIGIESGIWSVFDMNPHPNCPDCGTELVNTDFYFGIPLTFAKGKWSFRLRGYHISSHLGDEYMVNHPDVVRVNPSIEAVDFFTSYQAVQAVRIYFAPGCYVHSDPSYKWQPMYIEYGTEVRFLNHKFYSQRMHGNLFIALFWRNLQQLDWNFDGTYRAGYEFSKLQGVGRKLRFWIGYHHGYSLEGQFQKERTRYWEFDFNYGF